MASEDAGSSTEMPNMWVEYGFLASGLGCYQVCRQLEPADIINIITQPSEIAIFILGNYKTKYAKDTSYINFRNKNIRKSKYSQLRKTYAVQKTI